MDVANLLANVEISPFETPNAYAGVCFLVSHESSCRTWYRRYISLRHALLLLWIDSTSIRYRIGCVASFRPHSEKLLHLDDIFAFQIKLVSKKSPHCGKTLFWWLVVVAPAFILEGSCTVCRFACPRKESLGKLA